MKRTYWCGLVGVGLLALALAGCDMDKSDGAKAVAPATNTAAAPVTAPKVAARPTIRVKAGADAPLTDKHGNVWVADTGFEGGSTIDRTGQITITGTDTPEIYASEHYSMDSFSVKVPNGSYTLKLHFSEDYDGIADANSRLFTYAIHDGDAKGKLVKPEVKDFGPWKASGDHFKAYVDTVPVNVTQGAITIVFTPQVENPQINAIEVIPN